MRPPWTASRAVRLSGSIPEGRAEQATNAPQAQRPRRVLIAARLDLRLAPTVAAVVEDAPLLARAWKTFALAPWHCPTYPQNRQFLGINLAHPYRLTRQNSKKKLL